MVGIVAGRLPRRREHWILRVPPSANSPSKGRLPAWVMALGVAVLFLEIVGSKNSSYWNGDIPDSVYRQFAPQVREISHPGE
jgi:hypothetical protein